ncbi:hypothetical protein BGX27_005687 [Mortierella sp. AM989]|nr:hypothetical protein BGX27_005687 [Mortierella sp. AM989]
MLAHVRYGSYPAFETEGYEFMTINPDEEDLTSSVFHKWLISFSNWNWKEMKSLLLLDDTLWDLYNIDMKTMPPPHQAHSVEPIKASHQLDSSILMSSRAVREFKSKYIGLQLIEWELANTQTKLEWMGSLEVHLNLIDIAWHHTNTAFDIGESLRHNNSHNGFPIDRKILATGLRIDDDLTNTSLRSKIKAAPPGYKTLLSSIA